MIRIQQLKLRPDQNVDLLRDRIRRELHLKKEENFSYEIIRQSVDAHKRPDIFYSYTVDVKIRQEERIVRRAGSGKNISLVKEQTYVFPFRNPSGDKAVCQKEYRPVIIGSGPAGLFCALALAKAGLRPLVLERGEMIQDRKKTVATFWRGGKLDPDSNVQFGEGGAGTFSDGKLNTRIKDPDGRIRYVLQTFVQHGAPDDIMYSYKPHMGTDVLEKVIPAIREDIIRCGGEFRFRTLVKDIRKADETVRQYGKGTKNINSETEEILSNNPAAGICGDNPSASSCTTDRNQAALTQRYMLHLSGPEGEELDFPAACIIIASGHSSRDTFRMLFDRGFEMTAKSFAVGLRIQHPQDMINRAMYGDENKYELPPAPYQVTAKTADGRGVYSFCMCPGGYVVNASSEEGRLAVNGMSYRDRSGENANSAIIVTVSPEDYGTDSPLDGIAFQRRLEENAYQAGQGKIPVQRYEDFCEGKATESVGNISPAVRGEWTTANVRNIFPKQISQALEEGIHQFGRQIRGFDNADALLCAAESRTSSPVRITRDEKLQAPGFPGIFPCGEGAGYAGGIVSSAVDGTRVAEYAAAFCLMSHPES